MNDAKESKSFSLKSFLTGFLPPGMKLTGTYTLIVLGSIVSLLYSCTVYLIRLYGEYVGLFYAFTTELIQGAKADNFVSLLNGTYISFAVFMIAGLSGIISNYMYFYGGSKSIYVMKRLPVRGETLKRCITVPILTVLVFAAEAVLITILHFAFYYIVLPDECIIPGQLGIFFGGVI